MPKLEVRKTRGSVPARTLAKERLRPLGPARTSARGQPLVEGPQNHRARSVAPKIANEWRMTAKARELELRRPPFDADLETRAAWERAVTEAASAFVEDNVRGVLDAIAEQHLIEGAIANLDRALETAPADQRDRLAQKKKILRGRLSVVHSRLVQNEHSQTWTQLLFAGLGGETLGTGLVKRYAAILELIIQESGVEAKTAIGSAATGTSTQDLYFTLAVVLQNGSQVLLDPLSGPTRPASPSERLRRGIASLDLPG